MRRALGATIAIVALAVVLVVPAGAAGTKSGCKGKWTDAGVCSFTYQGGAFFVSATGDGGDPVTAVSVRLEAKSAVPGANVLVLSCGATVSDGPATCGGASTAPSLPYDPQPGDELVCTVIGSGSGKYRCSTGG